MRGREREREAIRKVLDNKERETDIFIPIPHLRTTNIVIQSELTRSFWDHYVRSLRERLRFVITMFA